MQNTSISDKEMKVQRIINNLQRKAEYLRHFQFPSYICTLDILCLEDAMNKRVYISSMTNGQVRDRREIASTSPPTRSSLD